MSSAAERHLLYKVANAPLGWFPCPHFYVQDVFPDDFYAALQANLPDPAAMVPIAEARPVRGYEERFVLEFAGHRFDALPESKRNFWTDLHSWLVGSRLKQIVTLKFGQFIHQRFGRVDVPLRDEALLIQDTTNYALGPHTDTPGKVVSFLFYLPKDDAKRHLGTSFYLPKDDGFSCAGGPHYRHEGFERLWTMPFLPNSLFAFFKNDVSFHGVERVNEPDCRRWLLLYDVFTVDAPPTPARAAPAKFSF